MVPFSSASLTQSRSYLGKSTGRGALSLWTHNLKTLQFIPSYSPNSTLQLYPAGASANATSSATWTGPALRMGAGVQAFEAYLYAASLGLRVVGGTCPTVGLAGGYTQGGGHSTLSGIYGLGADNVLEWEVVTAAGEHVVARPGDEKTGDLYWALSGGGAGTYAVVLSATVRLHPDGPVTGAYMTFDDTTVAVPNGSNEITANDAFWDAVGAFQALLPPILATGTTLLYSITEHTFNMFSLTAPGHSVDDVAKLLAPVFKELDGRGVRYKFTSHTSPNFITHFATDFGPLPFGYFSSGQLTGSRLVPRSLLRPDTSNSAALATLIAAQRNTTRGDDFFLACQALDVGSMENKILLQPAAGNPRSPGIAPNAVLPAWRDAASHCIVVGPWDYNVTTPPLAPTQLGHPMRAKMDRLTDVISPQLEAATPGSGTYLNEANVKQHDWQKHFYGANFQRLRGIKDRWDPTAVFYAPTAVGSEDWEVDGSGRLCRVAAGGSVVSA